MRNRSFQKKEHLKKSEEIKNVLDNGISIRGKLISIFMLKQAVDVCGINRVAFLTRKILYNKKTVLRNRFRRILKEAYRRIRYCVPVGYDMVIMATRVKKDTKSLVIEKEIYNVFTKRFQK